MVPPRKADSATTKTARTSADTRALPYMLLALAMLGYVLIAIGL
jgi:hypothetical protein